MSEKIFLTRNQLAKFLPTPEAIKAFENLFKIATQQTPNNLDEVQISAESALSMANYSLSVLDNVSKMIEALELQPPETPTISEDVIDIPIVNINECECLEIIKEPDWNFIKNHPTTIAGYGITDAYNAVVADAPLTGSGTTSSHLSIPAATALANGYLSSTDWSTFNSKQVAYTNLTNIGSLSNSSGWLHNDGSGVFVYSTPTKSDVGLSNVTNNAQVTSVSGTSPINSSGGITPTISIDKSDATHNGYLSSTDWSTFNSKEPAQTKGSITEATSSVLTITNGSNSTVGPNVTIQVKQATNAVSGYLSSTDWTTFNGKQVAYTNLTSIGGLANSSGWLKNNGSGTFSYSTPTATDVGLGNVTNNAQVKAITSTANKLVKFSDTSSTITNSVIYDDGTNIGIGTNSPQSGSKLDVYANTHTIHTLSVRNDDTTTTDFLTQSSVEISVAGNKIGALKSTAKNLQTLSTPSLYLTTLGAYPIAFGTNSSATPSMLLDTSGNVGIGTTSTNYTGADKALTINGSASSTVELNYGGTRGGYIFSNAFNMVVSSVNSGVLKFNTGDTERMRIDSSGNVGIGVTPSYKLHLVSDSAAKPSTNTWTISSDERLKENIELADLDRCYEIVKTIPLKRYTWKDSVYTQEQVSDRSKLGWIAQDVKIAFPKAVNIHKLELNTTHKEIDAEGNEIDVNDSIDDCLDLNADQLYAVMYGAIQKLQAKIEALEMTKQS